MQLFIRFKVATMQLIKRCHDDIRSSCPTPCSKIGLGAGVMRALMSAIRLNVGSAAVLLCISIMITDLYEINSIMSNDIYKPMFLSNSTRPNTWTKKFKRFRSADPLKRVSHYRLDQLENSKSGFAISLNPVP